MDYKSTLSRSLIFLLFVAFLTACDTSVSPDPLRITGSPPENLYYDAPFEFTFGATGGDGVYRYRYIQNPDLEFSDEYTENPVEMTIENIDGAKPGFILRAVPSLPEGTSLDEVSSQKHRYQIELTDGVNTVLQDYEFTLDTNKLQILNAGTIREGSVQNQSVKNLQSQLVTEEARARVCSEVKNNTFEKYLTQKGFAYPAAFQVRTSAPVTTRTTLFYRITTTYSESEAERSKRNMRFARKDVDYIDAVKSITFEPGQISCVVSVDLLDDVLFEDDESFVIEFFDHIGGAVDYSDGRKELEIKDNETPPVYVSQQVVRNKGDQVIFPVRLTRPLSYPTTVNISIDAENTTALESDYTLQPSSGVVTIPPNEIEASFSIFLNSESPSSLSKSDKKITILTDIDEIIDGKPSTIEINEWTNATDIAFEILGSSINQETVSGFIVDAEGHVVSLSKLDTNTFTKGLLKRFNKSAEQVPFSTMNQVELSNASFDVTPVAIVNSDLAPNSLAVIVTVSGLFADQYRGKTDFAVLNYQKQDSGIYELLSVKQYGTEGDDYVSGAKLINNNLYVYGRTDGENFEGAGSSQTNFGGEDGFLYQINLANNEFVWARFIGTGDNDNVVDIDVSNRELATLVSVTNSDQDILVKRLFVQDGTEVNQLTETKIASIRDDAPKAIRYDSNGSSLKVLTDSDAQLNTPDEPTPSRTRDIQLLPIDAEDIVGSSINFLTDLDDTAANLELSPNKQNLIVSGVTKGEMVSGTKKGANNNDAFVSILSSENSSSLSIEDTIQFGTSAEDRILAIKAVSNTKFFVLWEEKLTTPDLPTYRLSPFSMDGKKLSRDPE